MTTGEKQAIAIKKLAERKVEAAKTAIDAFNLHRQEIGLPKQFDMEYPLNRLNKETVSAHKAFMDFVMFGGDQFLEWARFRFPNHAAVVRKGNAFTTEERKKLIEKFSEGTDFLHLVSFKQCEHWCKQNAWRARAQRWNDISMQKLIQEKGKLDVEKKIELQTKMYDDLMNGMLAASREQTRRLVEKMKTDPNFEIPVKDLVALAKFAVQENKTINPPEQRIDKSKPNTLVQNNYHFGDVAKMIHEDVKDI